MSCRRAVSTSSNWDRMEGSARLTMPVARYHSKIVTGSATMYRMRWVKFIKRKKLPTKPRIRETAFSQ